ncbi:MAG: hypothetical protein RR543_04125, partial [Erysipelotrichales bacterium]
MKNNRDDKSFFDNEQDNDLNQNNLNPEENNLKGKSKQKAFDGSVARAMDKQVKIEKVKKIKHDYYHSYKKAMGVIGENGKINWQWFKKRTPKFVLFFIVIIGAVTGAVFAVEKAVTLVIDGVEVKETTSQISTSLYADSVAKDKHLDEYKVKTDGRMIKDKETKIDI